MEQPTSPISRGSRTDKSTQADSRPSGSRRESAEQDAGGGRASTSRGVGEPTSVVGEMLEPIAGVARRLLGALEAGVGLASTAAVGESGEGDGSPRESAVQAAKDARAAPERDPAASAAAVEFAVRNMKETSWSPQDAEHYVRTQGGEGAVKYLEQRLAQEQISQEQGTGLRTSDGSQVLSADGQPVRTATVADDIGSLLRESASMAQGLASFVNRSDSAEDVALDKAWFEAALTQAYQDRDALAQDRSLALGLTPDFQGSAYTGTYSSGATTPESAIQAADEASAVAGTVGRMYDTGMSLADARAELADTHGEAAAQRLDALVASVDQQLTSAGRQAGEASLALQGETLRSEQSSGGLLGVSAAMERLEQKGEDISNANHLADVVHSVRAEGSSLGDALARLAETAGHEAAAHVEQQLKGLDFPDKPQADWSVDDALRAALAAGAAEQGVQRAESSFLDAAKEAGVDVRVLAGERTALESTDSPRSAAQAVADAHHAQPSSDFLSPDALRALSDGRFSTSDVETARGYLQAQALLKGADPNSIDAVVAANALAEAMDSADSARISFVGDDLAGANQFEMDAGDLLGALSRNRQLEREDGALEALELREMDMDS